MCIISGSEIRAFSANSAKGIPPKRNDPVAEAVKEIFQNLETLKLISQSSWDSGTVTLFRSYITEKLTSSIHQEGFDLEKFKASEIDKFKSIKEEVKLKNRIRPRLDSVRQKYVDDPHYRMVTDFLLRNKDIIKSLLQKNVTGKEISKEGLQNFKNELLNLIKSQLKTLYPVCVLRDLDCLDELLNSAVDVEKFEEFHLKINDTIELETLVILVFEERQQKIAKNGGTCFGDSLLAASPLFQVGDKYSGSFAQFTYSLHCILDQFYDAERSKTGKEILSYPLDHFPRLRSLACMVLNCSDSELHTLDSHLVETILGRLAVMAIEGKFKQEYDKNAIYNILRVLLSTKSKYEKNKDDKLEQILGYWVFNHKEAFPKTWNYHSDYSTYAGFGCHIRRIIYGIIGSNVDLLEKEKLMRFSAQISLDMIPSKILNGISIREIHYHVIREKISLLPECIQKCAKSHNRYILTLMSDTCGHALLLSLGESFSFIDPNFYNPATCFSEVVNYQNIDDFIAMFVKYLAFMYEEENFTSFIIRTVSTLPETETSEIKLRKWIQLNNNWRQERDDFIQKIDAKARLLIVDKTLTPKERDKLKSELENGRLNLETNGAQLIQFHDQLKDMILRRIQYYENKLKKPVNPKLQQSYQRVINSYHSLIGQLCVNPQAVVRYTAQ